MLRGRRFTVALYLLLAVLSLLVFWPLSDDNDRYAAGIEAANRGDYATALENLQPLAEQGYPQAQFALAVLLEQGKGISQDIGAAAGWYEKAARQQVWEAQVNLGLLLIAGEGLEKDPAKAAEWFQQAANLGIADGQINLGQLYLRGLGVDRNPTVAARWFRLAAQQGHGLAQYLLAELYREGNGVPQSVEEAYFWSKLATNDGAAPHASAARVLAERMEQQLDSEQLMRLKQRLFGWQPRSGAGGSKG